MSIRVETLLRGKSIALGLVLIFLAIPAFAQLPTATILGTDEDLAQHRELVWLLEQKAGRLIFNGVPTGVEVAHAMVHGGPYPATSDSRFTSVGSLAIFRWARPVCFQNFPQALLPEELQDANPLGIRRLREGKPESL